MDKRVDMIKSSSRTKPKISTKKVVLITLGVLFLIFVIIPMFFVNIETGNIALIKVEGLIMGSGGNSFNTEIASSEKLVEFISQAEENPLIEAIVIEINSPGGSAVASDEVATALKKTSKPTVALIREVGASGAYWISTAVDHSIANRMSITGSIGVISSYLEFSGLMEQYGVNYQRMVAGDRKDVGTPLREMSSDEESLLQSKLDMIHDYFIIAVAENRGMTEEEITKVATGEFYLGVEAYQLGLIDELGDLSNVEAYLQNTINITNFEYLHYQEEPSLMDLFSSVSESFSYSLGEGIGSVFVKQPEYSILI